MRRSPEKSAAYTRTGILRRFLEDLSHHLPAGVDAGYAQQRLGLKGGDVRAFLQSLRVLGLIDPQGQLTERARRTRSPALRTEAMREAMQKAYPDLLDLWQTSQGLSREDLVGEFKVRYGLSSSSAIPAAKLFEDLTREYWREIGGNHEPDGAEAAGARTGPPWSESRGQPERELNRPSRSPQDVRVAAFEAIQSALQIHINQDWEADKIRLVFDRLDRLVERIIGKA